MSRIIVPILGFIAMVLILKYRGRVKAFTGDFSFAEKVFGPGGTNTFLVLFGVAVFVVSLMWAFGTFQEFVKNTFGVFV